MIKNRAEYKFGDKLRRVRERKKVTLKSIAEQAGISESLLSQIERNRVSPSIDTLLSITGVLDVDLEYLFKDYKKDKKVNVVKASERDSIQIEGVRYHQLSLMPDPSEKYAIEAFLLEIEKGSEKGDLDYGHPGNELGIILEGEGELIYGTQTYKLQKGDSVSFHSDIPHTLKNRGNGVLKAIWAITPPRMFFSNK